MVVLRNQKKINRLKRERNTPEAVQPTRSKILRTEVNPTCTSPTELAFEAEGNNDFDVQENETYFEEEETVEDEDTADERVFEEPTITYEEAQRIEQNDRNYFKLPSLDGGRRRSKAWQHFDVNIETRSAFCKVCNQKLSYNNNSTSNLLNHLKLVHSATDYELGLGIVPNRNTENNTGYKKTSVVWNAFNTSKENGKASCKLCSASFKHNVRSTSNLLAHIRSKHPELINDSVSNDNSITQRSSSPVGVIVKSFDPLLPKQKKRTSKVWEQFDIDEDLNIATCRKCSKQMSYSRLTTSNLLKHLQMGRCHSSELTNETAMEDEETADDDIIPTHSFKIEPNVVE